jgi:hypothetical protein
MLYIYCVGGGQGGAGAGSNSPGSGKGGGGGGASSAATIMLVPLSLLPDVLFIVVGIHGEGGATGANGNFGNPSSVRIPAPTGTSISDVTNILIVSGQATGGSVPSLGSAIGGVGGVAESVAGAAQMPLAGLGIWSAIAGQNGTSGGSNTDGVAISLPTTGISTMGGTGGGGSTNADFAGGAITAVSNSLISESRPQAATAGSTSGSGGFKLKDLMFNFPGLGGAASNTAVGGNGGNGGFGCGGGGGGGGSTGGRGGDGGSGLVVMIAW